MVRCEMCGKDSDLVNAVIEQVELKVCPGRAFWNGAGINELPQFHERKAEHKEPGLKISLITLHCHGQARERQGLTQEDFAKSLQEREYRRQTGTGQDANFGGSK